MFRDDDGSIPTNEREVKETYFSEAYAGSPAWHVSHDRSMVFVTKDASGQTQIARYYFDTAKIDMISQYASGSPAVNMSGVIDIGGAVPSFSPW